MASSPGLLRRFLHYVAPHRLQVAACFALILLTSLASLSIPIFSMLVIDRVLVPKDPQLLNILGIGVLSVVLVNGCAGFLQTLIFVAFKYRILRTIRMQLFRKVQTLDISFFIGHQMGYILSRIHSDAGRIATLLSNLLFRFNVNVLLLILGLAIMFYFHALLTLIVIAIIPIYFWTLTAMARKLRRLNLRMMEDHGLFQGKLQESVGGIRLVRVLGIEESEEKKIHHYLDRFFSTFKSLEIWSSFGNLIKMVFSSSVVAVILWYGGHQVIAGRLSIGELAACSSLVGFVFNPLEVLYDVILNLQESNAALARIFEILDMQPTVKECERPIRKDKVQGNIEFRNVRFQYDDSAFALTDITFSVRKGERLGLVGRTGAGKTTIVSLLLRYYDPLGGEITIDDIPLQEYAFKSLRGNIDVALQDLFLFEGTISEAIALGNEGASEEAIERAARMAQLHDRIVSLPKGYDTLIGEGGVKLSAGEKQRLSIARAILKDAPVLILDEATSAIDSASEKEIERALTNLLANKTTLVITHRFSTLLNTDRVLFLDAGRIVDSGAPQELLDRNPDFRRLFQDQIDCSSSRGPSPEGERPVRHHD